MIATWPAPDPDGQALEELVIQFDSGRNHRLLIIPALFDEANKLRRFTVEVMRRLDQAEVDSFLPDLPGCNESLRPLEGQSLASWRDALVAAQEHFAATHVLTIRAGALLAPQSLPGWRYAPQTGAKQLRGMIRARTLAARESGVEERSDDLLELGLRDGLELAGWPIGPTMFSDLQSQAIAESINQLEIPQNMLGGPGLWMRAEPDENPAQAEALAAVIVTGLAGT